MNVDGSAGLKRIVKKQEGAMVGDLPDTVRCQVAKNRARIGDGNILVHSDTLQGADNVYRP